MFITQLYKDDKNHFCYYNIELFAGMYLQSEYKFYTTILPFTHTHHLANSGHIRSNGNTVYLRINQIWNMYLPNSIDY